MPLKENILSTIKYIFVVNIKIFIGVYVINHPFVLKEISFNRSILGKKLLPLFALLFLLKNNASNKLLMHLSYYNTQSLISQRKKHLYNLTYYSYGYSLH